MKKILVLVAVVLLIAMVGVAGEIYIILGDMGAVVCESREQMFIQGNFGTYTILCSKKEIRK